MVMEEREREPVEESDMRDSANAAEMTSVKSLRETEPVERDMNGCDAKEDPISSVTVCPAAPFTERVEVETSTVEASLTCVPLFN